jgi:hypothetical protein
MKVHLTISVDIAIAKLLDGEANKSGIINRLLHNYFEQKGSQEIKQEKKAEKAEKSIEDEFAEAGL